MYRKMQVALLQEKDIMEQAEMHYQYQKEVRKLEYQEKKLLENNTDGSVIL